MKNQDRVDLEEYISKRLHISWLRLQESPAYQERCRRRNQSGATAKAILQKLDRQEHILVDDYTSESLAVAYLEQIESYLQGLLDCVPLLQFLGLIRVESAQ